MLKIACHSSLHIYEQIKHVNVYICQENVLLILKSKFHCIPISQLSRLSEEWFPLGNHTGTRNIDRCSFFSKGL